QHHTPQTGKREHGKKQQTKTTKHTIEFSNNTPVQGNPTTVLHRSGGVNLIPWAFSNPAALLTWKTLAD
ncbi:hypothetical protein ABIA30_002861, partial [Mycobacterium sp. MAA66]|uniref:hypothetical protein n=1 Tax=Mycobacterium sp. MAA66 TaxID=3156297 RepID=UPI0035136356